MLAPKGSGPLLVLTTSFPSGDGDGAGAFVRGLCRASAAAGLEVEVLCPELASSPAECEEPGVRVVRLPYLRPRRWQFLGKSPGAPEALASSGLLWAPALAYGVRLAQAVAWRARRRPYLGVLAHWLLPSALSGILGAPGLPVVGVAHGSDVHMLGRLPGGALLARLLLGRARALCFVSEDLRQRFARILGPSLRKDLESKSLVQPMGADEPLAPQGPSDQARAHARAALGLGAGPVVLWMGRLVPLKAPERAIELARALPEVTLMLAGEGPLGEQLLTLASGLGPRVRLCGQVAGQEKARLFAAADVMVLTSRVLPDGRTDSVPVVGLEALVHGLPVVATAVGGLGSLGLPPSQLRLVPDGDMTSLALAVRDACAGGRLAEPARLVLRDRFGWDAALPRILAPLL